MTINIKLDGLFKPEIFKNFKDKKLLNIRDSIKKGFEESGKVIRDELRNNVRNNLKIKKKSFLNLVSFKVVQKSNKNPILILGNRRNNKILIGQETGGVIVGKKKGLLIPLISTGRIGPKAFERIITNLLKTGNAFFIEKDGKVIIMAENIKENSRDLTKFKAEQRKRSGVKRIKKGQEIPIAVFVKSVRLKKKLKFRDIVIKNNPKIAKSIENNLKFDN